MSTIAMYIMQLHVQLLDRQFAIIPETQCCYYTIKNPSYGNKMRDNITNIAGIMTIDGTR